MKLFDSVDDINCWCGNNADNDHKFDNCNVSNTVNGTGLDKV